MKNIYRNIGNDTNGSSSSSWGLQWGTPLTNLLATFLVVGLITYSYFSLNAFTNQGKLNTRIFTTQRYMTDNITLVEGYIANNVTYLESTIISNNTYLNETFTTQIDTINNEIAVIQSELNITGGSGDVLANRVTTLENERLKTINGVTGDAMNNVDLIGGVGVTITPNPGGNSVTIDAIGGGGGTVITSTDGSITVTDMGNTTDLSNNGVRSFASASSSIFVDTSTGDVTITDNGVWSITSLSPSISLDMTTGNVQLTDNGVTNVNGFTGTVMIAGTDGIEITENMTYVNIAAPVLTTAIANLQMQDSNQAAQITALQVENTNQQMQIDAIEAAGTTIQEMFNNTDMDLDMFNTTLLQLISQVMMLQSQVEALQEQLDNATTVSTPTGTILPWSGVSGMLPTGFLHCDGSEYAIASYPALYGIVGTMYCPSMTCTGGMFAVPNLLGRVPVGQGGSAFTTLGDQTQGAEMVTMTEAQMPAHAHGGMVGSGGDHIHTVGSGGDHNHGGLTGSGGAHAHVTQIMVTTDPGTGAVATGGSARTGCTGFGGTPGGCYGIDLQSIDSIPSTANEQYDGFSYTSNTETTHTHSITSSGGHGHGLGQSGTHQHTIPVGGNGDPHPNIQPSTVVNYMIKT